MTATWHPSPFSPTANPWRARGAIAALILLGGCLQPPPSEGERLGLIFVSGLDFEPPDAPLHDRDEDGWMHARDPEQPFGCNGGPADCETLLQPMPDGSKSCDAAGCHGDTVYGETPPDQRHLHGGEGPSCYACHGENWD